MSTTTNGTHGPGPIQSGQYGLTIATGACFYSFVGSIEDRPVPSYSHARKFRTAADAACYVDGREHLAGAEIVGPFEGRD